MPKSDDEAIIDTNDFVSDNDDEVLTTRILIENILSDANFIAFSLHREYSEFIVSYSTDTILSTSLSFQIFFD